MGKNEVYDAIEIVLEEIESVVVALKEEGADAFLKDEAGKVNDSLNRIEKVKNFRESVKTLQVECKQVFTQDFTKAGKAKKRNNATRLKRGLKTPEDCFRKPILEALSELNGSASVRKVLDHVNKKMENTLNEHDRQKLPSTGQVRWENTAQWCRNSMVEEGLLANDSPKGVWKLSEKGKEMLTKWKNENNSF